MVLEFFKSIQSQQVDENVDTDISVNSICVLIHKNTGGQGPTWAIAPWSK